MDFGWALAQMKSGLRVRREGRDMTLGLQMPDPAGTSFMTLPYFWNRSAATGKSAPWTPSQIDLLAEDFELVEHIPRKPDSVG